MVRGVLQLVMAKKEMRVQCPCCETELLIDALTHKVLRYKEKGSQAGVTWGVANQRLVERQERGHGAFDEALSSEKNRSVDLDALFDAARKQAADETDSAEDEV